MTSGEELHDLRRRAHEAKIEDNSKMTADELRDALQEVEQGEHPQKAKTEAEDRAA